MAQASKFVFVEGPHYPVDGGCEDQGDLRTNLPGCRPYPINSVGTTVPQTLERTIVCGVGVVVRENQTENRVEK